ncbi:hypothetical protein C8F04DRAFT_1201497 [Mycena alexandri]|uniref:Uncharacterized protein n=1 Tax=Mycena alexandri TaxID=1745969 RepID=A0AAD6RXP1_9AGAR|nr:hypothetical protein C8F04DRAFT_1201497 [Mycena alexandri]
MPDAVDALTLWPTKNTLPPTVFALCIVAGEHSNLYDLHITRRIQEPVDVVCISHLVDEHKPCFEVHRIFFTSLNTDIGIGARLVDPAAWNGVLTVTTVHREHGTIVLRATYLAETIALRIDVRNRNVLKHVDSLNIKVNNEVGGQIAEQTMANVYKVSFRNASVSGATYVEEEDRQCERRKKAVMGRSSGALDSQKR